MFGPMTSGGLAGVGAAAALRRFVGFPSERRVAGLALIVDRPQALTAVLVTQRPCVPSGAVGRGGSGAATRHAGFTDARAGLIARRETVRLVETRAEERCTGASGATHARGTALAAVVARSSACSAVLPVARRIAAGAATVSRSAAHSTASGLSRTAASAAARSTRAASSTAASARPRASARCVSRASGVSSGAAVASGPTRRTRATSASEIHASFARAREIAVAGHVPVAGAPFGSRRAIPAASVAIVAAFARTTSSERDDRHEHANNAAKKAHGLADGSSHASRLTASTRPARLRREEGNAWLT